MSPSISPSDRLQCSSAMLFTVPCRRTTSSFFLSFLCRVHRFFKSWVAVTNVLSNYFVSLMCVFFLYARGAAKCLSDLRKKLVNRPARAKMLCEMSSGGLLMRMRSGTTNPTFFPLTGRLCALGVSQDHRLGKKTCKTTWFDPSRASEDKAVPGLVHTAAKPTALPAIDLERLP
jgi:hypothetical protein